MSRAFFSVSPWVRLGLRVASSAAFLALVVALVDPAEVLGRLARLEVGWVVAAVAVSVVQVVVSAWRWRYTAGRLGADLPLGSAVGEYYLATFLNQVLPGGVVGDVSRAWRHHRAEEGAESPPTAAVHAVILERASGQMVMLAAAAVAASWLAIGVISGSAGPESGRVGMGRGAVLGGGATVAAVFFLVFALVGGLIALSRRRGSPRVDRFLSDARKALLGSALPVQATLSVAIVASYVLVFVMGARAVGIDTSAGMLALTAPPILVAMLVPASIAGWGLREGAAAALWSVVGLSAADGVAVSVAYGLLVLVSSLPGAAFLLSPRSGRVRDRRGDPTRA